LQYQTFFNLTKNLSLVIFFATVFVIALTQDFFQIMERKYIHMMQLCNKLLTKEEKLSVIGLGYVGLPLAVAFSKQVDTIGFDIDKDRIQTFQNCFDLTKEIGDTEISNCTVDFTFDENKLKEAKFHIVSVPTPVFENNTPDLTFLISATKILGKNLTKGSIVVYESIVYPGVTEDICIPLLEKKSRLRCGIDFKVGYSPERINPGDKVNRLETIVKIVAGMDKESLNEIAKIYGLIILAGVHKVNTIKVAEAAKADKAISKSKVAILGLAFKENCPDIRNSKTMDIIEYLRSYGIDPVVVDPEVSKKDAKQELGIDLMSLDDLHNMDCVAFVVPHDAFKEIDMVNLDKVFGSYPNREKIVIDVKSMLNTAEVERQ